MGQPRHLGPESGRRRKEMTQVCSVDPMQAAHIPVLFQEVLDGLRVRPGGTYIDVTVGGGGHAAGLLAGSSPGGRLLGLDRDPDALQAAQDRLAPFGARLVLRHSTFSALGEIAATEGFEAADGVLMDLGLSSNQLADPLRGFTFSADGPLDMRFDRLSDAPTARDLVNSLAEDGLADLLRDYGEEPRAGRIARAIVAARPIRSTGGLADVVVRAAPGRGSRIHPATRTFQALRIAVNGELDEIVRTLPQAIEVLASGGRLAIICFHSLEDRLVKNLIRQESRDCICPPELPVCRCGHRATLRIVTRKPIRPSTGEVAVNRRSRSARLRIAERTGHQSGARGQAAVPRREAR